MRTLLIAAAGMRKADGSMFLGRKLLAGNDELGYYGLFSAADVITGAELAALVGIKSGTLLNSTTSWLGFAHLGKHLLIAQKPIRRGLSWNQLNVGGTLTGRTVVIKETTFTCRAPSGSANVANRVPGGEWDELMYRVAASEQGEWDNFTATDLGLNLATSASTPCRESAQGGVAFIARAAINNIRNYSDSVAKGNTTASLGWRPVLQLIE